jgi:hypothetical protein
LSWFLLGFSAGSILAAAAVWFEVVNWPFPTTTQREAFAAVFGRTANEGYRRPHLALQNSTGAINGPLPLGIVLNDSSGGETLVLSDLAEGTKLSAGTALSSTRWSVPGRDLDKAFIAAPENFSGSMQVTAKLYSSGNLILETKNIRFEWTSQTENRTARTDLTRIGPLEMPDLAAKGAIRSSDGSGLILSHGTDAPTTGGYSEASARGWGLIPLTAADWVSQISSVILPPDYHPFAQKPPAQPSTSPPSTPGRSSRTR